MSLNVFRFMRVNKSCMLFGLLSSAEPSGYFGLAKLPLIS